MTWLKVLLVVGDALSSVFISANIPLELPVDSNLRLVIFIKS
jgi:hypothetical protein